MTGMAAKPMMITKRLMYMDMTDYAGVYDRLTSGFSLHEFYERPSKSYVDKSYC